MKEYQLLKNGEVVRDHLDKDSADLYESIIQNEDLKADWCICELDVPNTSVLCLTDLLNQLVDAYGEDKAYLRIKQLLPKPEPKFTLRFSRGPKFRRWVHSVTAHEDAIVIHLSEEPAQISKALNVIALDLFYLKELKMPFNRFLSSEINDYDSEEVSSDE